MRRTNILPIAIMTFAIVAFLVLVNFSIIRPAANHNSTNTLLGTPTLNSNGNEAVVGNANNGELTFEQDQQLNNATSGWKTYTNSTYNYSVKYPIDFQVNESSSTSNDVGFGAERTLGSDFRIRVYEKSTTSIDQVIASLGSEFFDRVEFERKQVSFNRISAIEVSVGSKSLANRYLVSVIFEKDNKVFQLSNGFLANPEFQDFYSGFSFVQTDSTSGWKTYTNTTYHYTFQYPGDFMTTECEINDPKFVSIAANKVTCGTEWLGPGFSVSRQEPSYNQAEIISYTKDTLENPVRSSLKVSGLTATRLSGVEKTGPNVFGGGGKFMDFVFFTVKGVGYIGMDRSDTASKFRQDDFITFIESINFTT